MSFLPSPLAGLFISCDYANEDGKGQLKSGRKNWAGGRKDLRLIKGCLMSSLCNYNEEPELELWEDFDPQTD